MAPRPLRIFPNREAAEPSPPATNRITLRDLLPLIATAHRMNMMWLDDFLDDEVLITSDLSEVLETLRELRPSA